MQEAAAFGVPELDCAVVRGSVDGSVRTGSSPFDARDVGFVACQSHICVVADCIPDADCEISAGGGKAWAASFSEMVGLPAHACDPFCVSLQRTAESSALNGVP